MFRAGYQHATGIAHIKQRHGMNLLKAYNKSPLMTISQKGTEKYDGTHVNIASFVNRFRLSRKLDMAKTEL